MAAVASLAALATGNRAEGTSRLTQETPEASLTNRGRLHARPQAVTAVGPTGLQRLGLGDRRDGLLYVPATYSSDEPATLVLSLHGAGGTAQHGLGLFQSVADAAGLIVLAPDSRGRTWDVILGDYGPDVAFIDQALTQTFARYALRPDHLVVSGFSDGASYALSLGLTNGDLFSRIVAFSPGFMAPAQINGEPEIYISHGTEDQVLPIDVCSRRIVPMLREAGYAVLYHEFAGPHTVPAEIVGDAVAWLAADAATPVASPRPELR
jgi:phospholipase/carboxylesterase